MINFLYIPLFAIMNRVWGGLIKPGSREIAIAGIILGSTGILYITGHNYIFSIIYGGVLGLSYWFGRLWGIDVYFCVFNPSLLKQADLDADKGITWINSVCNTLIPNVINQSDEKKRLWGFIGFTLRGLYFVPLIAFNAYFNLRALYLVPGVMLMGLIYGLQYYQPKKWWYAQFQLPVAEVMYGGLLGLLIFLSLI